MKKNYFTNLLSLATLLILFAVAMPSFAQDDNGEGNPPAGDNPTAQSEQPAYAGPTLTKTTIDEVEYYVIASNDDYETFRQIVATGNPYANAILETNVTTMNVIGGGDAQFHYRGTFDGQGHTVTMNNAKNSSDKPWGLFQYTEPGCVIRNLKVSGTLISSDHYLGSIVGQARGTKIENCVSDATLDGASFTGGLVGISSGMNFIQNCAFIGKIKERMGADHKFGIIGFIDSNIEIKSCYVDATFDYFATMDLFTGNAAINRQVFLNNYYHKKRGSAGISTQYKDGTENTQYQNAIEVTDNEVANGKLCLDLNIKGKAGVVWYQHGDHPYPFKGSDGQLVTYTINNGSLVPTVGQTKCPVDGHIYSTGNHEICSICGALDPDRKINPLQSAGEDHMYANDEIYVGFVRYKLNSNGTATVKGTHKFVEGTEIATAVHIPETIRYNEKDYTVTKIDAGSMAGSKMEYCYIPKTVTRVEHDAFNNCSSLKYLHIADRPSVRQVSDENLWLDVKAEETPDEELFHDCNNLTTVYIGRDLAWDTSSNFLYESKPDEPFEDVHSITDVFIGPRVSRLGNYYAEDARKGYSYDLFNDCKGVKRVYVMGDDKSLEEGDIKFYSRDGLGMAKTWYINRTVGYTDEFTYTPYVQNIYGCLDNCETAIFGPFVKKIPQKAFSGVSLNSNTTLTKVDMSKCYNLEEVEQYAFCHCGKAVFGALDLSVTKMKYIRKSAFQDCDHLGTITIPASVELIEKDAFYGSLSALILQDSDNPITIGVNAFRHDASSFLDALMGSSAASIYQGRNIKMPGGDDLIFNGWDWMGSITIGPKVTKIEKSTYKGFVDVGALSLMYSEEPLELENNFYDAFNISNQIASMFIDREMKHGDEHLYISTNAKKSIVDLSIGHHQNSIPAGEFKNCTALKNLVIPESVSNIGSNSFEGCTHLENLFIAGDKVTINEKAFNGCEALENVYMIGNDLTVKSECFAGCESIKQVVVGLTGDPVSFNYSDNDAFTDNTYANAYLSSTHDTNSNKIEFNEFPWSNFKNRKSAFTTNNFEYGSSDESGEFEHASIKHDFEKNIAEIVSVPFEMDSYYFGSDVEIYTLSPTRESAGFIGYDGTCTNTMDEENVYKEDVTTFLEVDAHAMKTIPAGIYIIKAKRDIENMPSHHNHFNSELITVDNSPKQYYGFHSGTQMIFGGQPKDVTPNDNYFVCDGGHIKLVNGSYTTSPGQVLLEGSVNDHYVKQLTYDMVDEDSNVLLTSKADLGFNKYLEGYTTFYDADNTYIAPQWCEVYVVTSAVDGSINMEKIEDRVINKGQAVMIKSAKDVTEGLYEYLTYVTNDTSDPLYGQNLLKGVSKDTKANELAPEHGFVYVLSCNSAYQNAGFYKLSGERIMPAGKAYLDPDGLSPEQLAKACLFVCNDNVATGIQNADVNPNATESVYDLLGRKIKESGFKGIYIMNNKKVVVK